MSSHYDISADYLKTKLLEITDIGHVHVNDVRMSDAEERRVNFEYTLTAAPDTGTKVYRAWFVDGPGLDTELATSTQTFMTEKWEVHGFLAYVNDPDAEKTFGDRSKFEEYRRDVLKKFFTNLGLYGQHDGINVFKTIGPIATSNMVRAKFANILCWHLTITFEGTYDETF